jgi:type IV pilus assembly protein PilF
MTIVRLVLLSLLLALAGCATQGSSKVSATGSPADIYIDLALAYTQSGQLGFALENGQKAVRADARSANAQATLAYVYFLLQEAEEARLHFDRALAISPNDPAVRNYYGLYLCAAGDTAGADAAFLAAGRNADNSAPWIPYINAGLCYEQQGNLAMARERLATAVRLNSNSVQAVSALARVERKSGNISTAQTLEQQL